MIQIETLMAVLVVLMVVLIKITNMTVFAALSRGSRDGNACAMERYSRSALSDNAPSS